jgi:hypothetical protein
VPAPPWDPDGSDGDGDGEREGESAAGSLTWTAADDAVARHPAGRAKVAGPHAAPKGPDDDREFLALLEKAIRRNPPVS